MLHRNTDRSSHHLPKVCACVFGMYICPYACACTCQGSGSSGPDLVVPEIQLCQSPAIKMNQSETPPKLIRDAPQLGLKLKPTVVASVVSLL